MLHLGPKVVALAVAFAHAGEYRIAAVLHGDVMNKFLNKNGFSHARAAEKSYFSALGIGLKQIYNLYAGFEYFSGRLLLDKMRRFSVNGESGSLFGKRLAAVYYVAQHVKHTAERIFADRHGYTLAGIGHFHTAREPEAV